MNLKRIILLICIVYFPITGLFSGDLKNLRKNLKKIEKEDKETKKKKSKNNKHKHPKFNTKDTDKYNYDNDVDDENTEDDLLNTTNETPYFYSWENRRFSSFPYKYPVFYFHKTNTAYSGKEWHASFDFNYGYWGGNLSSIDLISIFTYSFITFYLDIRSWNETLDNNQNDNLVFTKFLFGFRFHFEENYSLALLFGAQILDHEDYIFGSGGFHLTLFPTQPLVIDISMFLGFKNWSPLFEFSTRVGFIINRFDFGIGYRAFSLDMNNPLNGLLFSVRTWF